MVKRVNLEPAFILHRRAYRNTSWILELFTYHYGRLCVLAKSARGLRSRYKGRLELFVPLLVSWTERSQCNILGEVEINGLPCLSRGESLLCGFYLNELLMRLLYEGDACPALFQHYRYTLQQLTITNRQEALRRFEKELLAAIGYALPLAIEAENKNPIEKEKFYFYHPAQGFFVAPLGSVGLVFSGKTLLALHHNVDLSADHLKEAKRLMRLALSNVLDGRPLKSRQLFNRISVE